MRDSLESQAEILKLGRLLGREPGALRYLEQIPAADIRLLRERVTDMLFDSHGRTLERLAASSRLLPIALIALIAQRAFGPVLSARLAGMLDPSRAAEVAARLPPPFLADIAVNLDPRRASEVIGRIPPDQIAQITRQFMRREEYVTMGRFVGHLGDAATNAALGEIDDRALLEVAFVLEDKSSLSQLVELLDEGRLEGIVDAAVEGNLWLQALDLLSRVDEERRARFVHAAAERDDEWLDPLLAAAAEHRLWDQLLAIVLPLDSDLIEPLTERVARLEPAERGELAERARAAGVLDRLGPVSGALTGRP